MKTTSFCQVFFKKAPAFAFRLYAPLEAYEKSRLTSWFSGHLHFMIGREDMLQEITSFALVMVLIFACGSIVKAQSEFSGHEFDFGEEKYRLEEDDRWEVLRGVSRDGTFIQDGNIDYGPDTLNLVPARPERDESDDSSFGVYGRFEELAEEQENFTVTLMFKSGSYSSWDRFQVWALTEECIADGDGTPGYVAQIYSRRGDGTLELNSGGYDADSIHRTGISLQEDAVYMLKITGRYVEREGKRGLSLAVEAENMESGESVSLPTHFDPDPHQGPGFGFGLREHHQSGGSKMEVEKFAFEPADPAPVLILDAEPRERMLVGEAFTVGPVEVFNDEPLEGAVDDTLNISEISEDNFGDYYVRVEDDRGRPVESQTVELREALPLVDPVDWSDISPDMVDDEDAYYYHQRPHQWAAGLEHSLAYYLGHFHRVANAVREEEPNRGFIDLHVWRHRPFATYNARIMESILSLAWFYTKDAPWNPYYADEALRLRLEAAMLFWIDIQHEDGAFSEYGAGRWNLPATAFATKFIGEAMVLLEDGPPIDSTIHQKMRDSWRKAIMRTFESWWEGGRRFTNQYTNAFAGALAYLYLYEDEEMEAKLQERMKAAADEFVSPAGYMYERDGPDWGYYFGTHHSNVQMIWHYGRDLELIKPEEGKGDAESEFSGETPTEGLENKTVEDVWETFGDIQKEEYKHNTEWLTYNAVPQPDRGPFYLNRTVETRTRMQAFKRVETPLAEVVPAVRAFNVTEEERRQRLKWCRRQLEDDWGDPPSLETGTHMGFSPYAFLHRDHITWYPTEAQRQESYEQLPYIANDRFVHQRVDDRRDQVFTYIRRPGYYVAFNAPTFTSPRGIGLAWHPVYGALLQSQQDYDFAWGAVCLEEDSLLESGPIDPDFLLDGESVQPQVGKRDLPDGEFVISYAMQDGERRLQFNDEDLHVSVNGFSSSFAEQIPLLLGEEDELDVSEDNRIVQLNRGGENILTIEFDGAEDITLHEGEGIGVRGISERELRVVAVSAKASESLNYSLIFNAADAE